ncbi:MAG: hypothetical protein HYT03_01825 [Candidatus Harrisonbacteria bacterium]|nr:hypothetical protein [Candidatus Harrisonbacteria bacterium]
MIINSLYKDAQALRDAGYSYNMISEELGIAKSTLSNWFKDRPFKPNSAVIKRIQLGPMKSAEKKHNKKVSEIEYFNQLGIQEVGSLTQRDLWLLGLGLYIGEGTKSHEMIRIINANPAVIKLAIKWFKEVCGLSNENITIAIHLYPDNNVKQCLNFWHNITGLPRNNFRKTQIDRRTNKLRIKNKKLPYGTANLSIISRGNVDKGVRLCRRIHGWMNGVLSQA